MVIVVLGVPIQNLLFALGPWGTKALGPWGSGGTRLNNHSGKIQVF